MTPPSNHPGPGLRALLAVLLLGMLAGARTEAQEPPGPGPSAPRSRAESERLFSQGCSLFRSGIENAKSDAVGSAALFRDAAAAWRSVALGASVHNARLELNIANASVLGGDIPRAIAAYRRAQALDPFDQGIRDGLAAARRAAGTESLAPGTGPPGPEPGADAGLRGTLRRIGGTLAWGARRTLLYLPARGLLIGAGALYVLAFLAWSTRTLSGTRVPRWAAPAALALGLLAAGPLLARELAAKPEGVVIAQGLIARDGPGEIYDPAFQEPLRAGIEVQVLESRAGWQRVRFADGRSAWIPEGSLDPL